MTHEHDLDAQIREWLREVPPVHPNLEVTVLEQTLDIPQRRRSWWPFGWPALAPAIDSGRFSWTGAAKYVVAGLVVGLFGGFLLMSVLVAEPGDDVAPAGPTTTPAATAAEATSSPEASPSTAPVARTSIPPSAALDSFQAKVSAASTQPVAPGVARLLDDGARHQFISWREPYEDAADGALRPLSGASIALDGSIWIAGYGATGAPRVASSAAQARQRSIPSWAGTRARG